MCKMESYTSQRAASLEEGRGPARKGLALQGLRALEERDEVFIVLFDDYSGVSGN